MPCLFGHLHLTQNKWKIDDVLGVWPLHGICGAWGGIAAGIFGLTKFGGLGGVTFLLTTSWNCCRYSCCFYRWLYYLLNCKKYYGYSDLTEEEEFNGADITIHKINSVSSDK